MHLSFLVLVLGVLYIYLALIHNNHENFNNKTIKGDDHESIYDDFYVFLLDDLFYDSTFYENFCKAILHYSNSVYNNHLCIGIKHGGHINALLKKNIDTTTISKSKSIVKLCNYNYSENKYKYVDKYELNSFIFNENEFTHISLIDNEVYYTKNINGLIYNVSKWIANRGYLFIDVYQSINNLKDKLVEKNNGQFIKLNYKYSHEIRNISSNKFYFIEDIEIDNEKKSNYHELTFYSIEYLIHVANECGLSLVKHYNTIGATNGRGVLVLQKL